MWCIIYKQPCDAFIQRLKTLAFWRIYRKYTYKMGIPTLGIGVIDYDSNIHAPDEFVRLSAMLRVKRILRSFIEQGK